MPMKSTLKKWALAALLISATVLAQTPYDEGQKALREQRWMDAAAQFEQAIKADRNQADAAMYWSAYAYYKAGRSKEAERELRRLERKYPDSRWVKEAQSLRIENQDSMESIEQAASGDSAMDDELRLFALSQLMDRDPERAMPLVMDLMRNSDSQKVREDALFVLALSETPEARQALSGFARDSENPELQRNAIRMLGTMDATAELQALYPTLQDTDSKVAVIEAFSIAGDSAMFKQVLAEETDPELRQAAIYGIAMEDNAESAALLESLYQSTTSVAEKTTILEALSIMDEAEDLALKILTTETDPELQQRAIHVLGIMDATEALGDLYVNLKGLEARTAVIEAMSIANDTAGLFKVLQKEQNSDLRSAAIHGLAISGGAEARDYLVGLYPDGSREEKSAVIESMMIMDDTEGLLGLLKLEEDPGLKRVMLQMLTTMDSEEADEYLFDLLEKNG
jgi:tetratricopeptide (TPR) repeat protein